MENFRFRSLIDPKDAYPSEGLRQVERNALAMLEVLPTGLTIERTRDAIQIDSGGEEGVVLLVTPEALEIRIPLTEWTLGGYAPTQSSRLWKRVRWKRKWDAGFSGELQALVDDAFKARQDEFKNCGYCGNRFSPDHTISSQLMKGPICHGCASDHEQVVF